MEQAQQSDRDDAPTSDTVASTAPDASRDDRGSDGRAEEPVLHEVDIAAVEAVLFATDSPLSPAKIADVVGLDGGRRAARKAVETLNERYERMGCSFRIESLAGGCQMLTLPEFNDVLARLLKVRSESKLSQAAMETLAIVAYRQPVLRADIEAIRGVSAGEVVRSLMEKGLVKIVGRAEEVGRPMLYGTTKRFLEVFGLESLKDLPKVAELAVADNRKSQTRSSADTKDQGEAEQAREAVGSTGETAEDPPAETVE